MTAEDIGYYVHHVVPYVVILRVGTVSQIVFQFWVGHDILSSCTHVFGLLSALVTTLSVFLVTFRSPDLAVYRVYLHVR